MFEANTYKVVIILLIVHNCHSACFTPVFPQQIHLSLGESSQEMVVTWLTFTPIEPYVWYKRVPETVYEEVEGFSKVFIDEGPAGVVRYIHRATLTDLEPESFYEYMCGSVCGVSSPRLFKTYPLGTNWSPRLLIFGDMGVKGAVTLPYIQSIATEFQVDVVFHVGDIAYNMDSENGVVGDNFFRMIEPIASSVPYMTAVGNHEQAYNFSHYKNRFSMPGGNDGLFYSFNLGPVHFVVVSTEVYYFTKYGCEQIITQYNWLLKDLERATYNRAERPWIVVFGHRPLYCSSDGNEDCSLDSSVLRRLYFGSCNVGLEDVFHKYRVDLIFSGHMHYYERSWPIYNNHVYNGSFWEPYRNPKALVHVITGAAGMESGTEWASHISSDFFAFYSCEYSFTLLNVFNKTHLYTEQVSVRTGQVIDSMWLVKD